ncbi:hypothetical protein J6590_086385 [Homalodisca vitripennis]|nr:hypothetical protein J6590_086385 [Homalodisca vitripennis]
MTHGANTGLVLLSHVNRTPAVVSNRGEVETNQRFRQCCSAIEMTHGANTGFVLLSHVNRTPAVISGTVYSGVRR